MNNQNDDSISKNSTDKNQASEISSADRSSKDSREVLLSSDGVIPPKNEGGQHEMHDAEQPPKAAEMNFKRD